MTGKIEALERLSNMPKLMQQLRKKLGQKPKLFDIKICVPYSTVAKGLEVSNMNSGRS
jgi:hypothetical protein